MSIDQELAALTPLEHSIESVFRRNFSRYFEPDFLTAIARFVAKGTFSRTYSLSVGTQNIQLIPFNPSRVRLTVFNLGAQTVFYGTPHKVTSGPIGDPNAGIPILTNTSVIINDNTAELWIVSGTPGQDVRVEEVSTDGL